MKQNALLVFVFILLVGSIVRLFNLSNIPPGVNRDEASIGYTAYSLLTTGKDEYGRSYPISFQSFGDWKLPFYIYTTVPFVAFFGLNELAVRLPSALFGIGTIGLSFFLFLRLTNNKTIALFAMGLLAIAPWHIHLSRVESESNTAVFFVMLGVLFFLKSLKEKEWYLIITGVCLGLSYFIYAGNHVFTTLLVLGLVWLYWKEIRDSKWLILSGLVFACLSGFIFYHTLFGADHTKISGISILSDKSVVNQKIDIPRSEHPYNLLIGKLLHNKVVFIGERTFQNYLNAFAPQFLFIKGGDNKAHNISNFGNMYLIEAIFFYAGMIYLFVSKKKKEEKLVLFWLLISPIAASITKDAPHTNRMFAVFPILPLVTSYGLYSVFGHIQSFYKRYFYLCLFVVCCLFLANISLYIDRYFVHFPLDEADSWGVGYKKLNDFLKQPENVNKKIIITHPEYSPYIYLLFYSKYDPKKYQEQAVRYPLTEDGFAHVKSFGNFEFRDIDFDSDFRKKDTKKFYTESAVKNTVLVKDEYFRRDINWANDFALENTLLVDYVSYPQDSRTYPPNTGLNMIFASYKKPMFVITEKK